MAEEQHPAAKKVARKRGRASTPAAGAGGIHQLAAEAAQQAEAMKNGAEPDPNQGGPAAPEADPPAAAEAQTTEERSDNGSPEGPAQDFVPTQTPRETPVNSDANEALNQNSGNQETQNSGLTSGNPENQKSRNQEEPSTAQGSVQAATGPVHYLDMVYEGVIDPYDDFRKTSTQLPPVVSRTLKAAAPIHGISVQQLLRDIILGRVKPLPESHPDLLERFYKMAQQGRLK